MKSTVAKKYRLNFLLLVLLVRGKSLSFLTVKKCTSLNVASDSHDIIFGCNDRRSIQNN